MPTCRVTKLGLVSYADALTLQKETVARLQSRGGDDILYLLEHPHVITIGRNADGDAITADRVTLARRDVSVVETDRGGDVTYHGPGQLVGYPLFQLEPGRRDIRRYVHDLEDALIRTLADFGIAGRRDPIHRGVWTEEGKIASLGIRIARWVTSHGFALNVSTDLSYFDMMNPCGIAGCRMVSMATLLGAAPARADVEERLVWHLGEVFQRAMVAEEAERRAYVTG